MTTYTINNIFGYAYYNAIIEVISTVNRLGVEWNYEDNWYDAHRLAEETNIRFDCNGKYAK